MFVEELGEGKKHHHDLQRARQHRLPQLNPPDVAISSFVLDSRIFALLIDLFEKRLQRWRLS